MKYKSATETMAKIKAEMIDAESKEFFDIQFDISADESQKEIETYAERKARAEKGPICKCLTATVIEKHDITYRIPWSKFLENAEVWKIDGVVVK